MREAEKTVYFVTGNKGKYDEVARIADDFDVHLKWVKRAKEEIQSDDLKEIACFAAKNACVETSHSVVADDSGFFVDALGGFPGPYSSYVFGTIGIEGILRLLGATRKRSAYFKTVVAFCEPNSNPISFSGIVKGVVGTEPRGMHGFGFDPIFLPNGSRGHTFAQMSTTEKNSLSHRSKAFSKLFGWLTK